MLWVRNSEVQDFLKNRARWQYRWVEGLVPNKPQNALAFGTAMHKFIEVLYTSEDYAMAFEAGKKLLDESGVNMDEVDYQTQLDIYEHVTVNYTAEYAEDFHSWEVIATELSFAIPLDEEIGFTGTIDLVVRDKRDGNIWFLDHKTTTSIEKYDQISDVDTQITKYWWALQQLAQGKGYINVGLDPKVPVWGHVNELGLKFDEPFGFVYNLILKDYPVPPNVLKNGSLSKAKNQKTTHDLYFKALLEKGLATIENHLQGKTSICNPEYGEILTYLKDNPKQYFKRVRVFRNQTEIDNTMLEFYDICKEISYCRKGSAPIYRTINFDTLYDPYLPLYRASMDGSDVEFLKNTLYTKEDTTDINL